MKGAVGPGLFEAFDRGVDSLAGGGEGTSGQHFDLLCVSDFGTSVDDFLSSLLKLLGEVSKLQRLAFDEGVPKLLYRSVNEELVRLSRLENALSKGVEWGLCTIAGSCAQFDREHRVSFAHGEMGAQASVVMERSFLPIFTYILHIT